MFQANNVARLRFLFMALGVALSGAISLFLNLAVRSQAFVDDPPARTYPGAGLFTAPDNAYGLYDAETVADGTTYRWTGQHSTWTYPYLANLGRHVDIDLRLASWVNPSAPAHVTVALNGKQSATFDVTPNFKLYSLSLDTAQTPNPYLDPAYVQVDLTSTTFTPPGDPRRLGVAVDWVQVQPRKSNTEVALNVAVWVLSIYLLLLIITRRTSVTWAVVYGGLALATFAAIQLTATPRAIPATVEVALAGLGWVVGALLVEQHWPGELAPRPKELPKTVERRRPGWGLALVGCMLLLVVAGRWLGDWQIDDAYISYRYAWNLAHGSGLVYNPGEVVEGYTNFLWTVIASAAIWVGMSPAGVALAGAIACGMGLVALSFLLMRKLVATHPMWQLLPAILLAADSSLITYSTRGSGIEAVPFAFLIFAPVAALWVGQSTRWNAVAGVLLALASLTRPEGLLVVVVLLGAWLWQNRRGGRTAGRMLLAALLPYVAIMVPYQLWRITFYGWPFPNTFYAKTGASGAVLVRGAEYALQFVRRHWLIAALAPVWAVLLAWASVSRRRKPGAPSRAIVLSPRFGIVPALGVLSLVYTLYVVYVGGDWFPSERFFVPLLAPLSVLATMSAIMLLGFLRGRDLLRAGSLVVGIVVAAYVGFSLVQQSPNGTLPGLFSRSAYENPVTGTLADSTHRHNIYIDRWGAAGVWLRENTPPGTWTAARGAGAIAYYSQRPVIDMYGLNDLHIGHLPVANMGDAVAGHEKSDPAYVLSRQPAYVLASWEDYFDPVAAQLKQQYGYSTVRSPLGPEVKWLVRK